MTKNLASGKSHMATKYQLQLLYITIIMVFILRMLLGHKAEFERWLLKFTLITWDLVKCKFWVIRSDF